MRSGYVRNPLRRPPSRTPDVNFPRAFHERLPNYAATPLLHLPDLANELGIGDLWVKDESARMGLRSFDILGASWALYRTMLARLGRRPTHWDDVAELRERLAPVAEARVIVVSDGEFGVAASTASKWLGLSCTAYVPGGLSPRRLDALRSTGAHVVIDGLTYDDALAKAAADTDPTTIVLSDSSWEGYADVPRWVTEGSVTVFEEIDDELRRRATAGDRQPLMDAVVTPLGTGSLAAAAALQYRVVDDRKGARNEVALVGAEPALAACFAESAVCGRRVALPSAAPSIMASLARGLPSPHAWEIVADAFDGFGAVDETDAEQAVELLAKHGVQCAPSGAAAVAAILSVGRDRTPAPDLERSDGFEGLGPRSRVVAVVAEGSR